MARMALLLLALVAGGAALKVDHSAGDGKDRPVTKVVNLLKDMQATLQKEADEDADLYDKLVCWCETNDKSKTEAIATENQMIADLTATIEETGAKHQQLTTDVEGLRNEVAKNTAALEEASALRAKENDEFSTDEKDATSSISGLKGAVEAIGANHGGASLAQVTAMVRHQLQARPKLLSHAHHRQMLSLLQQAPSAGSYAPASGEIFGILKQMKESFEGNLESSRKDEAEAAKSFAALKAAKNEEIKASGDKAFNKEKEAADALLTNAEAKQDLKNTEAALEADTNFLADLKKQCEVTDGDWDERSKMRQDEIAAVSDTIAMLTGDEARDLFSTSLGFIQLRAEAQRFSAQRAKAVKFLADAGKRLNSPRLSYLATKSGNDPFGSLRESIDGMAGTLVKEGADEAVQKDDCVHDFDENDNQSTERNGHKEDVTQAIAVSDATISELNEEEARLKAQILDAQLEMKKASENREAENKEFQQTVSDQRATQAILKKAVERLGEFYNKFALNQQPALGAAPPPPPGKFKAYKKGGGGGAMALIEGIIADSENVEKDATHAEQDAQVAYEEFIHESNEGIKAKQAGLIADNENEAKEQIEESNEKTDKTGTIQDIVTLGDLNQGIHKACDFTLNNFDARKEARSGEVEALKQAKAIFSGAGFGR